MNNVTKILLIPLDNRPVSYCLPEQVAEINKNISVISPPREFIGGLTNFTDIKKLFSWLEKTLIKENVDYIVCSLDTVAYGGLIPSRRSPDSADTVKKRIDKFFKIVSTADSKAKIFAFSSIMRISNNNINEEEKLYWGKYGEAIFQYSYLTHKSQQNPSQEDLTALENIKNTIPENILDDYLQTRDRNFNINKAYMTLVEQGSIDYLVYSQDDTGEYGINVQEALALKDLLNNRDLSQKISVRTGADEIPTDLVTRTITSKYMTNISIYPVFSTKNGKNIISRYEDKTIEESAKGQITLCGAKIATAEENADLIMLVHTPEKSQNDHCMQIYKDKTEEETVESCISVIKNTDKPIFIADISSANGGDPNLVENMIKNIDIANIYGYAGWNTTGNTLGTSISMAISKFISVKTNSYDAENFKKLLLIRFCDDWAYQVIVRQSIRERTNKPDINMLNNYLQPYIELVSRKLNINSVKSKLSFPWNRTFEVEIDI